MKPGYFLAAVFCSALLGACLADDDDCEVHGRCNPLNDVCDSLGLCTDDELFDFILSRWDGAEKGIKLCRGSPDEGVGSSEETDDSVETVNRKRRSAIFGNDRFDDPRADFGKFIRPTYQRSYDWYSGDRGNTYRGFYYRVPKPTYRKSFSEGKWHLSNKQMIKNYYKKGTYETAKKYFIALPFVKIIPVTKTTSVDYIGELQTYNNYRVRLCERCNDGYPQIEFQSLGGRNRNVFRRFNFLPETKRTRTEYGTPKIIQTGQAKVSHMDNPVPNFGDHEESHGWTGR